MVSQSNTPQSNFQNSQNYSIDIPQMYQDFITGGISDNDNVAIDDIRSQINLSSLSLSTATVINSLNLSASGVSTPPANTSNTTTPSPLAQESRCHAFYRIIGFPVVSSDKSSFYNPGYDPIVNGIVEVMPLAKKITIAENPITGFEKLSQARENYPNVVSSIFATPTTTDASILSLTSGTIGNNALNIRIFAAPFPTAGGSSPNPFDTTIADQQYPSPLGSYLIGSQAQPFSSLFGIDGSNPDPVITSNGISIGISSGNHSHIIVPFTVDPRIDFATFPIDSSTASNTSKKIAVPFVANQANLKISATSVCERPLLEKVIRDRLSQDNQLTSSGTGVNTQLAYINSIKSISNETLVGQLQSSSFDVQTSFANYLMVIQSLIQQLVYAIHNIQLAQSAYYWIPQPSTTGPEGGCSVNPITIPPTSQINPQTIANFLTPADQDIVLKQSQALINSIVNNLNSNPTNISTTPDINNFSFSNAPAKLTFNPGGSNSFGDIASDNLDQLNGKRTKILSRASQSLQVVEMIMGEFSGLGLADIVAIMGSLYVVDINALLAMLDPDSITRMNTALGTSYAYGQIPATTGGTGLQGAMTTFAATVKSFYLIMDDIFKDYWQNNASNV